MIKTANILQNVLFFWGGGSIQVCYKLQFIILYPICINCYDCLMKWITFVCDVVKFILSRYVDFNIDGIVQQGFSNSIFCWIYSFMITWDPYFPCCVPIKYKVGWRNIVPRKYHITVFKLRIYIQLCTFKKI